MKTVAIIGAGAGGLPAIKSCLEEGLEPTCFEMTGFVGGLWNYVEDDCPDRATVFRGVVMNTSKEMSSYSDFPAPREFGTFMPNNQFVEYCHQYAQHFGLIQKIKFHHKVLSIKRDATDSTKWVVEIDDLQSGRLTKQTFDFVMVCNGHHCVPNIPEFPGRNAFQGQQLHSQQYRKPEDFEGKRVLVVGFGNSACDIAVECSNTAKKVLISARTTYWILPRQQKCGTPWDTNLTRWNLQFMNKFKSFDSLTGMLEDICNYRFDHKFYGVAPKARFLQHYPVANDIISYTLLTGKAKLVGNVKSINENSVNLEGERLPEPVDTIIYGTGFQPACSFLESVVDLKKEIRNIYKMMFPNSLMPRHSLAFVGLADSNSFSNSVLFEMQARYIAGVFSGRIQLPSSDKMLEETRTNEKNLIMMLGPNHRFPTYIDAFPYMESLAEHVGCKPRLGRLLFKDRQLLRACLKGPALAYHYRIDGPHCWKGAREAILGFKEDQGWHMRERLAPEKKTRIVHCSRKKTTFLLAALGCIGFWFFKPKACQYFVEKSILKWVK